jgi:hypothetical protein
MNVPAYAIGLPSEWVAEIKMRSEVRYIAESAVVPKVYASEGKSYLESQQTPGRYLQPECVLWYGYFPDSTYARKALAISNTPTFPSIRRAFPWDDKMTAVIMAQEADHPVNRGFHPPLGLGEFYPCPSWAPNTVLKWGNSHCGENKQLLVTVGEPIEDGTHNLLSEPYVDGESYRVLVVGQYVSYLRYTSSDWRKNVQGKVEKIRELKRDARGKVPIVNNDLAVRTLRILSEYNLDVAGVDFVVPKDETEAMLLEVNTYPSLDEDAVAREHFIEMAVQAVRVAQ